MTLPTNPSEELLDHLARLTGERLTRILLHLPDDDPAGYNLPDETRQQRISECRHNITRLLNPPPRQEPAACPHCGGPLE